MNFFKFSGGWIGKHDSVLSQTFHSPSVSWQETPAKVSGSTNLPFTKKKPIKLEILTFSPTRKKLSKFLGGWIGKHDSVLSQTFHSPSVSWQETPVKVSGSTYFAFRKKKPTKLEILTFSPTRKKLSKFLGCWIGNQESVFPQTFHVPSVSEDETFMKDFGSTNLPFTKNKPIKPEILTLWPTRKKFLNFLRCWIGNQESVFP